MSDKYNSANWWNKLESKASEIRTLLSTIKYNHSFLQYTKIKADTLHETYSTFSVIYKGKRQIKNKHNPMPKQYKIKNDS